jgi:hypothetical protein
MLSLGWSASNADAGLFVAPGFVAGQIIFLIAFVLYLAAAIFALVLDFDASGVSAVANCTTEERE